MKRAALTLKTPLKYADVVFFHMEFYTDVVFVKNKFNHLYMFLRVKK